MELLVNREDLEISGIDRVPEISVKRIHERISKTSEVSIFLSPG